MEQTTLPASSARRALTVATAESHGVATITTSAPAAVALSAPVMASSRSGHAARRESATSLAAPRHESRG